MNAARFLCVAAFAAASSPAQFVWPSANAATPGNAVLNAPFSVGSGQPLAATRCLVVLDASAVPFPTGTTLTRLALRRDVAYAAQAYAGATGSLRVRIGRAAAAPAGIADVRFARLFDGVPTIVYSSTQQAPFVLPAAPAPGGGTPPFSVIVPFSASFQYQGGPLAIELFWVPTNGTSAFRVDAHAGAAPIEGFTSLLGSGCPGSNGLTPFHYVLPETTMPGASLTCRVEGLRLPPSPGALENFAMHALGFSSTSWQGTPLPYSLGAVGAPPACLIRVDPLATTMVPVADPSAVFARAQHSVPIPADPSLVGVRLCSQWLQYDGGVAAPLPVVVSDALAITLGQVAPAAATPMARTIWKFGATGFDTDSGRTVTTEYAPVMQFQ